LILRYDTANKKTILRSIPILKTLANRTGGTRDNCARKFKECSMEVHISYRPAAQVRTANMWCERRRAPKKSEMVSMSIREIISEDDTFS
jgi:hypothetical protein